MRRVNIGIGELHVATEPTVISTILGSCVSVCLFDPVGKAGGMNHILLPGKADLKAFDLPARFGINVLLIPVGTCLSKLIQGADL